MAGMEAAIGEQVSPPAKSEVPMEKSSKGQWIATILAALIGCAGTIWAAKINVLKPSETQVLRSPEYMALSERLDQVTKQLEVLRAAASMPTPAYGCATPPTVVAAPAASTAPSEPNSATNVAAPALAKSAAGDALPGTWRGTFNTTHGETGMTLVIDPPLNGEMSAKISYYPTPRNLRVKPGSYTALVTLQQPYDLVSVQGVAWIDRPPNDPLRTLIGSIAPGGKRLVGILDSNRNYRFELAKEK